MPSKIYQTLMKRKIDTFIGSFILDANSIFKDKVRLLHPGEYGSFREETTKKLIEVLLDGTMAVSNGFIITSTDKVSTQCDLIIYNSDTMPLIQNGLVNFFPIEEVNAIIEIKSTLSKSEFKKTLIKMAKNKMLTTERAGLIRKKRLDCGEMDDIGSYLICARFSFDIRQINLKEVYGDIPQRYWHNGILSIQDGYLGYRMKYLDLPEEMNIVKEKLMKNNPKLIEDTEYPVHIQFDSTYEASPMFYSSDINHLYYHIMEFISNIDKILKLINTYQSDVITYLGFEIGRTDWMES